MSTSPSHENHCGPCEFSPLDETTSRLSPLASERLANLEEGAIQRVIDHEEENIPGLAEAEELSMRGRPDPITPHVKAAIGCGHIIAENMCPLFEVRQITPSYGVIVPRKLRLAD